MELDKIRTEIDKIDEQILNLLNERYNYVKEVGKWKKSRSHEIYVPEREKKLLSKLEKINTGPLQTKVLRAIYREIMSGALALEHPLTIAYTGDNASSMAKYAALGKFGKNVNCLPYDSLHSVFSDVANERVDYGIIPVENSRDGVFSSTLDEFITSEALICAEINVCFHKNLLSRCSKVKEINTLYCTKEKFEECSVWISRNLAHAIKITVETDDKAAQAALNTENSAVIANPAFSTSFPRLHSIVRNVENNPDNITRYLIIGKQKPKPTGDDKTTICYVVNNESGALCDTLMPFKENNITATMFESRPVKNSKWEYCFFIDYLGHCCDKSFNKALSCLRPKCTSLKILGSYPKSDDIL
ncbi:MAG: chorismate mutase [Victivallales bacterium]|nr:chorismate mutase [Victivallales bacterium]